MRTTVLPLSAFRPPAGSWLRTVPGGCELVSSWSCETLKPGLLQRRGGGVDLLGDDVGDVDERRAAPAVALADEQVDDDGREQAQPDDGGDDRAPLALGRRGWLALARPGGSAAAAAVSAIWSAPAGTTAAGAAITGRPRWKLRRSARRSSADWYRASTLLAIAARMIDSSTGGMSGTIVDGMRGTSRTCFIATATGLSPVNGGCAGRPSRRARRRASRRRSGRRP